MIKAGGGKKVELVCILCNQPLASLQLKLLSDDCLGGTLSTTTTIAESAGQMGPSAVMSPAEKTAMLEKDQVVATKCGHMFHQGCLKMHVHQTLDTGRGVALFCPSCRQPFTMSRLRPVIIPATKAQKERYDTYRVMKAQNTEMHLQLQEIRAKISEAEKELKKIKVDSEECLNDIQAKQKLLDSISGPTNKEMAELTKLHLKRQEILHVVTQHNADLLKLLEEESILNPSNSKENIKEPDLNQNYMETFLNKDNPSGRNIKTPSQTQKPSENDVLLQSARKSTRKLKKKKGTKKSRRKDRSESQCGKGAQLYIPHQYDDTILVDPPPPASRLVSSVGGTAGTNTPARLTATPSQKQEYRKIDTCLKWEEESLLEPMNERSSITFSDVGADPRLPRNYNNEPRVARQANKQQRNYGPVPGDGTQSELGETVHPQDSVRIILSRKPPMDK